jgi:hypothetical protein
MNEPMPNELTLEDARRIQQFAREMEYESDFAEEEEEDEEA